MKTNLRKLSILMSRLTIYLAVFFYSLTMVFGTESDAQRKSLKEISFQVEKGTYSLGELFHKIESSGQFKIAYLTEGEWDNRMVEIESSNWVLQDFLEYLSLEWGLAFKRVNETISVNHIKPSKRTKIVAVLDQITISGKITDESGESLPGASVLEKGTSNGTITDVDGMFSLSAAENGVLTISFVGFKTQEVSINGRSSVDVALEADISALEEVVVVGYGTQKKVNLTGAVDVVTSERLADRPITSTGEGLQGLIPNLNVTVTSGDPTDGVDFNVRGYESINGGSPLILVDNVPMDLNRINPEDIESVTVLKDGAASAIYGARAAFGVILVETKKGKKGINVNVGSQLTWNRPIWKVDPITNGYEYALLRNQVSTRNGGNPYYGDEYMTRLQAYWDDPANNEPFAVVNGRYEQYGTTGVNSQLIDSWSPRQKYDLSISGSNEKASYYTSFGALNTDGYLENEGNDNFKRYNVLLKGDFKVNDWLAIDQSVTINIQKSDKPSQSNINDLIRTEPIRAFQVPLVPGYEEYEGMFFDNPFTILADLALGGRTTFTNSDTWLKSGITLTPIKRLTFKSNFSYNFFNRTYQEARLPYQMIEFDWDQPNPIFTTGDDRIDVQSQFNQYYVWNTYAEYLIDDWKDHYIKAMVGFNQEWDYNTNINGGSRTFNSPTIVDIGATSGLQSITGGKSQATLRGAFYRLNYIFKDRYLFEANGRYDGTSRFPEDDRFGFFPSFSAGWRISEEAFMASTRSVIDNLKFRASYGSLGNQLLGNNFYPYIASMPSGFSTIILGSDRIPYVNDPGLVSPTLTWEEVITQNLGLDMALFGSKLQTTFDLYTRDTKKMLLRREYPDILGTGAPQENGADLRTKGWEVSIKWKDNVSSDFKYYADFNLADWTAEITKYDNPTGALSEYYVGQQLGEIWGYETVGIIQNEEQFNNIPDQSRLGNNWAVGDIEFADLNDDGIISPGDNTLEEPGDRRIIGNESARYTFGLNTGVTYKDFSLNLFFQGVGKRDYAPGRQNWTWFYPWRTYYGDRQWVENSWTPENRDAYYPEMQTDSKNFVTQTRFLQNAAYVRLKNITISYNIPVSLMDKIGLTSARVYVGAQNLWEFSKIREPLDPEYVFDNSIDYPLFRSYTVGININL